LENRGTQTRESFVTYDERSDVKGLEEKIEKDF